MRAGNQVSIGLMVALGQAGEGAATHFDTFDHIVSVSHITSLYDDDLYHDSDVIGIYDHLVGSPEGDPPKFNRGFEYRFDDKLFIMSRTYVPDICRYDVQPPHACSLSYLAGTATRTENTQTMPIGKKTIT